MLVTKPKASNRKMFSHRALTTALYTDLNLKEENNCASAEETNGNIDLRRKKLIELLKLWECQFTVEWIQQKGSTTKKTGKKWTRRLCKGTPTRLFLFRALHIPSKHSPTELMYF